MDGRAANKREPMNNSNPTALPHFLKSYHCDYYYVHIACRELATYKDNGTSPNLPSLHLCTGELYQHVSQYVLAFTERYNGTKTNDNDKDESWPADLKIGALL